MAFNATTGLGIPVNIKVSGNRPIVGSNDIRLSLSGINGFPTTYQLAPSVVDAGGNAVAAGTSNTLTAVAASTPVPYVLTAASAWSATNGFNTTTYTGTITGGASNAYAGRTFIVTGFVNAVNNGTYQCSASTATTLVLINAAAIAETHAGAAQDQTATAVYTGTFAGGAANALAGQSFVVSGFTNATNNGSFFATGSSATTVTVLNPNAISETHAGTAVAQDANLVKYIAYTGAQSPTAPCVSVSATGLVTALALGHAVVEISYPSFNSTQFISAGSNIMNGLPSNKAYGEINVKVIP